jgi:hypothetical protein
MRCAVNITKHHALSRTPSSERSHPPQTHDDMEEFSDFEEIDAISESDDQADDEQELPESLIDHLTFPQSINPFGSFPTDHGGWRPPWLGHGDKLIGVVDMGR